MADLILFNRRRKIAGLISFCCSLLLMVWLLSRINWNETIQLLRSCNKLYLILAGIFSAVIPFFSTYRWLTIIKAQTAIAIPFSKALRAVMMANFLNAFLPSKLGDMSKAIYIHRKTTITYGIGTVILERLVDLFVLGLLGVVGSIFSDKVRFFIAGASLSGASVAAFGAVVFFPLTRKQTSSKVSTALSNARSAFTTWLRRPKVIIKTLFGSLGVWSMACASYLSLTSSLEPTVNILNILALFPLAIIAGLAPFTISGIGTRDVAFVSFLTPLIGMEAATLVGVLYTIYIYWFIALLSIPFVLRDHLYLFRKR